jgi:TPR repeat protein
VEIVKSRMTKRKAVNNAVIDSEFPWRVTRRDSNWPSYAYKMSVSEWKTLLAQAKGGDPEAEWEVADRYADGCKDKEGKIMVRRSARRAAQWFRRAAEHGNSAAQNNLGILLSNGSGVRKNVEQALFWLRKAFHTGNRKQNVASTAGLAAPGVSA